MSRDFQQVQQQLIAYLVAADSPITDFSDGSVAGALIRSLASLHAETDLTVAEQIQRSDPMLAAGDDLDRLVEIVGLARRPGRRATGFALASSPLGYEIVEDEVFTHLETGLQFRTTYTGTVLNEQPIPLSALSSGSEGNLSAGLLLVPSVQLSPDVRILVGNLRKTDGQICGDLANGENQESDAQLRNRYLQTILNKNFNTSNSLRQAALQLPFVTHVDVRTLAPGVVDVRVRTPAGNPQQMSELRAQLEPYVPVGTLLSVSPAKVYPLDLEIEVRPLPGANPAALQQTLERIAHSYINTLNVGQSYDPKLLSMQLRPLVRSLQLHPGDVVTPEADESLEIRRLNLCFLSHG